MSAPKTNTTGARDTRQAAPVDIQELARRVYALMLEDLRLERARREGR
ncbi:hypothetical protein [Deinococcus maricopensis]|uniref:Uncharacterized protein n=1 Tax=Deinococcus maricopensis (strain DSM 21211 / LMG 22137 / NRRL B-23946 / LB-34) TaxID=709986 RepID=E8U3N5_DEIML|nr:hypothetical protein [Deinococcus maricopensis]ADV68659.1 hypothetical protein Deima_3030 [Deinococcus maricopensis DSM 21211]